MEKNDIDYSYDKFIEEGKKLCFDSNNNFKFCLNELLNLKRILIDFINIIILYIIYN